jgi:hypothetical protein
MVALPPIASPQRLSEAQLDDKWFKEFVESYRCRVCKIDLNLDNFGGLGPNHGIFCRKCYE